MFFTKLRRVIKAGFINFWRNAVVSFASVFVMAVALFIIGGMILSSALFSSLIAEVKEKVDVNVYLRTDAKEEDALALKTALEALPEVRSVDYLSREAALAEFRERHSGDELVLGALDELDENPLGAVLNVRAHEPSQYEGVAAFLSTDPAVGSEQSAIVDKVNFFENKIVIDRLTALLDVLKRLGVVVSVVFIGIAILVTMNTVRVAIFASREEIAVMKLVGASHNYTRGPFIAEGMMNGVVAAIITTAIFYPITLWFSNFAGDFFGSFNVLSYYLANMVQLLFLLLAAGVVIGAFSSWLAVRRYLGN